ncbi:MAG TPA: hypothetical protein VK609_06175 [Mucilaginibacter sp.]|nr:hypothetical protein [Mucilaginibacter sp.]
MKKVLFLTLLSFAFAGGANAQQQQQKGFTMDDFKSNLGKTGTLCDTVYSLKIVSDTLTLLNMGAAYPRQKYTIAVKGNKTALDLTHIKGKHVCVTVVFEMFRDQPEVVASRPEQFQVH